MRLSFSAFVATVLLGGLHSPLSFVYSLTGTDNATCGATPDPHFHTWDNIYYDYQGGCDLILINNSNLELQIRTEPQGGYSSISDVALKVGGGSVAINDATGIVGADTLPQANVMMSNTSYSEIYEYIPGAGQFIRITRWAWGMSVQIQANGATFAGSEGMCGSWNDGGINDRDGSAFSLSPKNTTAWAFEWQVQPSESLFDTHSSVCTGSDQCSSGFPAEGKFPCQQDTGDPTNTGQDPDLNIRSRELTTYYPIPSFDQACSRSCNDIDPAYPEMIKNCIFDVIVTGNPNWACNPSYMDPVIIIQDSCPEPEPEPEPEPDNPEPPSKWERLVAFFRRFFNKF